MINVLHKKDWDYTVYEENDRTYIEVLCGSSALFEVKVLLSQDDMNNMQNDPTFLDKFAQKVRRNPSQYI